MKKHTYVLGTGLSHDGSACLLKDGKVCVAIEKERITRVKHDGLNDTLSIKYCLEHEGITVNDLDLVVQSALYGGCLDRGNGYFQGKRFFQDHVDVPVITISHHLAHAYSTIGRCPFGDAFDILVIDGSGSPYSECIDLAGACVPEQSKIHSDISHLYFEKDSYYRFEEGTLRPLYKDFAAYGHFYKAQVTQTYVMHSIGSLYQAISNYCFRNQMDTGKLMGLGPYGKKGVYQERVFDLQDGRVFINHEWLKTLDRPARSYEEFRRNFQYYADIACHVQQELERAILYTVDGRLKISHTGNLCYAGGVALNAVANNEILSKTNVRNLYIQPAAGDNGIALGCAYYGWYEELRKKRTATCHQSTCFGKPYSVSHIERTLQSFTNKYHPDNLTTQIDNFFSLFSDYQVKKTGKDEAVIRFEIIDYCHYDVLLNSDGVTCSKNSCLAPTCTVWIDKKQLVTVALTPVYFNTLLNLGRIKVTNSRHLQMLISTVDFEKMAEDPRIHSHQKRYSITGKYRRLSNYVEKTAELLAEGKVIGWFQDGSEFGPRALGRRSILADPRNKNVRDYINSEIKFREDFRPFAPAVLREEVGTYFKTDRESPYMVLVDYIKEDWHDRLKSIVHENNTSRIQTVTECWNPKFYHLLQAFKRITGLPMLLNTSFNCKGMPIVETPAEALDFFHFCKLDYLVMDEFIIEK